MFVAELIYHLKTDFTCQDITVFLAVRTLGACEQSEQSGLRLFPNVYYCGPCWWSKVTQSPPFNCYSNILTQNRHVFDSQHPSLSTPSPLPLHTSSGADRSRFKPYGGHHSLEVVEVLDRSCMKRGVSLSFRMGTDGIGAQHRLVFSALNALWFLALKAVTKWWGAIIPRPSSSVWPMKM